MKSNSPLICQKIASDTPRLKSRTKSRREFSGPCPTLPLLSRTPRPMAANASVNEPSPAQARPPISFSPSAAYSETCCLQNERDEASQLKARFSLDPTVGGRYFQLLGESVMVEDGHRWIYWLIESFIPIPSFPGRKGAPDTVRKASRYAEWYKQENPNRDPTIDQFFDAVVETRKRQAASESTDSDAEHLLDAAFKELDRHARDGKVSPLARELVTSALVLLNRDITPTPPIRYK